VTVLAEGSRVRLRRIEAADLGACASHRYTLSIVEPLTGLPEVRARFAEAGFWTPEAGALAIEAGGRLVGTMQYYRSGPGMHGYEIGYILHSEDDRGKGYASDALRTFTGFFFASRPDCHRLQLIIETWNDASARLAEVCGYEREGVLRKAGYSNDSDPPDVFVYARVR
jgi:RimJ/RimL family protein N-acetyltransferase